MNLFKAFKKKISKGLNFINLKISYLTISEKMLFRLQIKCFQIFSTIIWRCHQYHFNPMLFTNVGEQLIFLPCDIFNWNLKEFLGLRGLVNCLGKIAKDLDEEMSTEPRTNKSNKSIGDILLENGHICNSPSGKRFLRLSLFTDDNEI